jgi:protein O-mannosyl-transferase
LLGERLVQLVDEADLGLSFWKYILWMSAPVHMSMQRSTSTPPNVPFPEAVAALGSIFVLCVGIVSLSGKVPLVSASLAWTTLAILPFCGIVHIYQGMAERFEYFASAGLALAVTSLLFEYEEALK